MEEGFIEVPEGADGSDAGVVEKRSRFLVPIAVAVAVILFAGGAFAFGKYAGSGSPPFLANISSLFTEAFSNGGKPIATIPLGGEREITSSGGREAAPVAESGGSGSVAARANSQGASVPNCTAAGNPSHAVLINEVAWAGTASDATAHEWIEFFNPGSAAVSLAGWQLVNKSGGIRVAFGGAHAIEGEGYFLLERKDDAAVPGVPADAFFQGAIRNSDETLALFDARCGLADEVKADVGSGKRWSAGEAAPGYRSAERSPDFSWHAYQGGARNGIFGTPRAENSLPPSPAALPARAATGTVPVSAPSSTEALAIPLAPPSSSGTGRVIISEVMAGMDGANEYEFAELYNADTHAVDLTGWYLKKRSSAGKESTLVSANAAEPSASLEGKIIEAGRYLLLANSGGYTGAVATDVKWPKSYTLAYTNNAVILYNAAGEKVDEAAWTEIPKGSGYARVPPDGGAFAVQAVPTPQNAAR
ncbi:MAG: lamin tail domain-containing protein [Candidatus Jorgensenbacteria bacterium]